MSRPPTSLPTTRAFLTNLLNSFSPLHPSPNNPDPPLTSSNAATLAPAKPLLLTLHACFPTTLLPALDLLDRRLVSRLLYVPSSEALAGPGNDAELDLKAARGIAKMEERGRRMVYYVKSSVRRDGRSRFGSGGDGGATSYEVRTQGWSCSCAAFAFAAFNAPGEGREGVGLEAYDDFVGNVRGVNGDEMLLDADEGGGGDEGFEGTEEWRWGGLMVEDDVPLCKHLLACVLAEHWSVAGGMVEEREVGRGEMAGWAAGWGG